MIQVKEAVKSAYEYFKDINEQPFKNLLLEEVEFNEKENAWYITLGYDVMEQVLPGIYSRKYKLIKVDATEGTFQAMKIRNVS